MGFFNKIKEGLKKTRDAVIGQIDSMLKSFTKIDDELFEELEELLVMGDVGVPTAEKICSQETRFVLSLCGGTKVGIKITLSSSAALWLYSAI